MEAKGPVEKLPSPPAASPFPRVNNRNIRTLEIGMIAGCQAQAPQVRRGCEEKVGLTGTPLPPFRTSSLKQAFASCSCHEPLATDALLFPPFIKRSDQSVGGGLSNLTIGSTRELSCAGRFVITPALRNPLDHVPQMSDFSAMTSTLLNTRELSKATAKVLRDLPKTGPRVITRGGETVGILIPPSGGGIESDIDLLSRLRFGWAIAAVQREAVLNGSDKLTMEEIAAEIRATRKERKQRKAA